ncbi:class I SAM-dependent methyltransferase [Tenacibaculum caenipelagi]|uniref:Methyltransferase family protein n=1 Tax=Tenacibaculum caenipelagi TaxID=1325435 RepID=A0A4R6THN7_9FLAO|nr:class I SAM-dependent methyltransferase [Tenacibaculum caenipelagi]TDQ25707.1 methyltransferase family protein [Tenacibaculum caenipelagi]
MNHLSKTIEQHYLKEDLYEDIVQRLSEMGKDLKNIAREDIAGVDEFHVRGAAVSKELAESIDLNNKSVLDVGCGLGGPCRMLAETYNCTTSGIDLSNEYIRTAKKLSQLVKLEAKTSFVQGDATALPFEDESFDVVWTQHVQMNVPDKQKFYSEIYRVLKPSGFFLYYDILKNNDEIVKYPMPWATSEDHSFLFKSSEMNNILTGLGFTKVSSKDQTQAGIEFFGGMLAKIKEFGPPKIGLNVLMGETTKPKLLNLLEHFKNGSLILESGVYKK